MNLRPQNIAFFQALKFLTPGEFNTFASLVNKRESNSYTFFECGVNRSHADMSASQPNISIIDWSSNYGEEFICKTIKEDLFTSSPLSQPNGTDLEIAIAMLQRTIHGNKPNIEQLLLIHTSISYWRNCGVMRSLNIAIFAESPHSFHDYMAYLAFKDIGVQCFILQHSLLHGRFFVHGEDGHIVPNLDDDRDAHIETISTFVRNIANTSNSRESKAFSSYSPELKLSVDKYKKETKSLMLKECLLRGFSSTLVHYSRLKSFYEGHASKLSDIRVNDHDTIHIYPLNIAPEATTVPLGGKYYDPRITLQKIGHEAGKNDLIIIKEHPMTFLPAHNTRFPILKDLHYRSEDFYQELISHKRVRLLSLSTSVSQLLGDFSHHRRKTIVWSVNSTTSLESFVMGFKQRVVGEFSPYIQLNRKDASVMHKESRIAFLVNHLSSTLFRMKSESESYSSYGGVPTFDAARLLSLSRKLSETQALRTI